MKDTINWNFDNSFSRLSNAFKEHIKPVAVKNPELVLCKYLYLILQLVIS